MARVCVIRQLYYANDPLLRREVGALLADGHQVDVLCMRSRGEPSFERSGALTIRRVPLGHIRGPIWRYLFEYAAFFFLAAMFVTVLHLRRRYDLIQVNTPPDSLAFSAIVPKLLGVPVLLHVAETMPEFFATKFKTSLGHPGVRLLGLIERLAIGFADGVLTCTDQMRDAFAKRGSDPARIKVVLNAADESAFDPTRFPPRERKDGEFVLISHGTMEERYGLDTTIEALALLRDEIPGLKLLLYGGGSYRLYLERLAVERGLSARVSFSNGFVPLDDLVQAISQSDAGVVAMKRDAFRDITHCNKMFDFIAMRKPAIVSRTESVDAYFGADSFELFESNDAVDLARAIRAVYEDPARRESLVAHASARNEPYRWPLQRERYLASVRALIGRRRFARASRVPSEPATQGEPT
jgi:glycosyltransferase involved in cell wall biosynthesis